MLCHSNSIAATPPHASRGLSHTGRESLRWTEAKTRTCACCVLQCRYLSLGRLAERRGHQGRATDLEGVLARFSQRKDHCSGYSSGAIPQPCSCNDVLIVQALCPASL